MKKIIHLVLILIKYHLKKKQDAYSFSISCLVLEICDVIYSLIRIEIYETKQRISLKKPIKLIQFFHEYAPTQHSYIRVKFE